MIGFKPSGSSGETEALHFEPGMDYLEDLWTVSSLLSEIP
jgi:hypothetical protein